MQLISKSKHNPLYRSPSHSWWLSHPARAAIAAFGIAIGIGTVLLYLPAATEGEAGASLVTALFTATSAVCVTGLIVVDTSSYWSTFGEIVILALIQVGGFGIITVASLFGLAVARRLRLRLQLSAHAETKILDMSDLKRVVLNVAIVSASVEMVTAIVLTIRWWIGYDESLAHAMYLGMFHAISAFNNAGFVLFSDSLVGFSDDAWIWGPIAVAVAIGAIGFPVLLELRRHLYEAGRWSVHAKVTFGATGLLVIAGMLLFLFSEWTNPGTLGPMSLNDKLSAGFFHAFAARTSGFNTVDTSQLESETLLITDVLMFIGGGSASAAGGIKVTTFALLGFVILAELRGDPTVHVLGRRLSESVQRQALTIALLGVGAVVIGALSINVMTPLRLELVLFEVISALGTVGLSTGVTASLPPLGHVIITVMMLVGRLGPVTLGTALAVRERQRRYELPEERPIVG